RIKPVSILFSEYYFYLIAYDADDTAYKPIYFRIDRISSITEHRENYTLDKRYDFDEGDLREKNQFMFPGDTVKIRFEFSGLSLQAILDRLPTAKVVEKNGSTSIIEAEVNHGRGIIMYLLSQGSWVKVLSPRSLIDEMKEEVKKMQSYYK
ncbi:MAG: WYL domain-containing protein, partial [Ruminococcus sp.]